MSSTCEHSNPLKREGTAQTQRLLEALIPENVKLHELTTSDWLSFAKDYATLINFYTQDDADNANGNWEDFFTDKDEIEDFLKKSTNGDTEPHLALFLSFLYLLSYPQNSLNGIPKRHLDYYYKTVLQLQPETFTPDTVHILFELAKNALNQLVESGSKLEAGKDSNGIPLTYTTDKELVVNPAKIDSLKSVFVNKDGHLKYASMTNSKDGLGEKLDGDLTWSAFGDDIWPEAQLSVYLASKILSLKEGNRTISVTWGLNKKLEISGTIKAILTGENDWLDGVFVSISGVHNHIWTFTLLEDEKGVFPFDEKIHKARLDTKLPVLKFEFSDAGNYVNAHNISISSIEISVEVNGIKDLKVENETGRQSADKSFMPFGPRPKKDSVFKVESNEFKDKEITSFDLNMVWLNMPPNFTNHYSHYKEAIEAQKKEEEANSGYFLGHTYFFSQEKNEGLVLLPIILANTQTDTMRDEYELLVTSPYTSNPSSLPMFKAQQPVISVDADKTNTKGGEIEVRLNQSLYHDLYNDIYVSIITSNIWTGVKPEDLPNEPYTPLLDSLSLNYKAKASITLSDTETSGDNITMFHAGPFGTKQVAARSGFFTIVSSGQFFVGMSGCKARDNVSILFQVAEGTENPENSSFLPDEKISWSVLTNADQWVKLDETAILGNSTNNFLKPGIVKISLPESTGLNHYVMDDNLVWIKAELSKPADSVANIVGVHTQAVPAIFFNHKNSLEHLQKGLPEATIKQLTKRKSKIKGVSQPYPSVGGKPVESDSDFYRRVSERLRHKDRALTIYDYEHLVLQEFPRIHKVKCLNHTKFLNNVVDELCPRHVSLVIIPKLNDSSTTQRLTPMVSQNTKDAIKKFLTPKHSIHVQLNILNPVYEEVRFNFKVKFLAELDYNFYRLQLDEDIIRFMAPWVYDNASGIRFDKSLYSFDMINFIENLQYVDFLEFFSMEHKPVGKNWDVKKDITPSNSLAVLIPAQSHNISESTIC
jgi:hypothetical protein